MLGEMTFAHYYGVDTFSNGRSTMVVPYHYVKPHDVGGYMRSNGSFVKGYRRDGDGDTGFHSAMGYFSANSGALRKG